jgi:hypothetical protein
MLKAVVAVGDYAEAIKARPLRVGEGIVGSVAKSGVAEMVNTVENDPRQVHIPGTPDEHEALLCAPLIAKNGPLGVMVVARSGDQPPFERLDFDFFTALAAQAVIAIENARLYDSERQQTMALSKALAQQQELDQLKNAFIQNVSHELRTPLAIIRGYAELMVGGDLGELSPEQRESAEVMARRTRMLSKMLDDLLTILAAETHKLEKELVDLAHMAELAVTDFQASARQAGCCWRPRSIPAPDLRRRDSHAAGAGQLVGQCLKFTPEGGRVVVSVKHTRRSISPRFRHRHRHTGRALGENLSALLSGRWQRQAPLWRCGPGPGSGQRNCRISRWLGECLQRSRARDYVPHRAAGSRLVFSLSHYLKPRRHFP